MPVYTYKCNDCEHVFEARQRMTDDPLTECPNCAEGQVRRVINSVGIVFKGSGFYVTDSRNGKSATVSSNGSGASETSSAANGSTSDKESKDKKSPSSSTEKSSEAAK